MTFPHDFEERRQRAEKGFQFAGWKEWVSLPEVRGIRLRAKLDSGAKSSALHVEQLQIIESKDGTLATFVLPKQKSSHRHTLPLLNQRLVRNSGGHLELRPFVRMRIHLGPIVWDVEVSLTNRHAMRYRMLLGRSALANRFVIHPSAVYLWGGRRDFN